MNAKRIVLLMGCLTVFTLWAGDTTGEENQEIKRLFALIEEHFYTCPDQGIQYVYELEAEAGRQGDAHWQAYAKAKRVEYYYPMFDHDSIFAAARDAEEFARRHKEYHYLFLVQQTLIQRYTNEGRFALGLDKARTMLGESRTLGSQEDHARAVAAMANLYKHLGRYAEAIEGHRESLRLLAAAGKGPEEPLALENYREVAMACLCLHQYDQALLYADSMRIAIARMEADGISDDSESLFIAEYLTTEAHTAQGDLDSAALALVRMDRLYSPGYPQSFLFLQLQARANFLRAKGEYAGAYAANEELLALADRLKITKEIPQLLRDKAGILRLLGRTAEALPFLEEAFDRQKANDTATHNRQLDELHTLYHVDQIETRAREDALRLRFSRKLALALGLILALSLVILCLIVWQVRRIRAKNQGLVRRIRQQERLMTELEACQAEIRRLRVQLAAHEPEPPIDEAGALYARLRQLMADSQPYTDPAFNWKGLVALLDSNERALRNALKTHLDLTVSEYLTLLRLDHAQRLLTDTDYTIEAIGADSGFGSRNTFYRLFREYYGLTPYEFRKTKGVMND
ncbi:helix-turn-helix domain-containing protein [Parabacteroides sp. PF5-6]|uniref:helix-turn-helix domain-containing protein n=1 Tax=Parabacteroides sp. PF5-6 TaxID=1742403 RepID=UPI0024075628|nr:helix-turn-helix domain-containing protein [Parabacteroides sp. PF5-6]MDF9831602.1 AraC-like DNA-binding protein [Parabacteroides sp. PF5-6]